MVDYVDNKRLIQEVEKRPALYNKKVPEYVSRSFREKLWDEVCESLIPGWYTLDWEQRKEKSKDIQKRWANIRDRFVKALNVQEGPPSTQQQQKKKRKRRYIYHDDLLFLRPIFQDRKRSGIFSLPPESCSEDCDRNHDETDSPAPYVGTSYTTEQRKGTHGFSRAQHCGDKKHKSTLSRLKKSPVEEIDEDKTFLMSLLPSFKELLPQQKLVVKMDFLQVIQRTRFKQGNQEMSIAYQDDRHQPQMNPFPHPVHPSTYRHEEVATEMVSPNHAPHVEVLEVQPLVPAATYTTQSSIIPRPPSMKQHASGTKLNQNEPQKYIAYLDHSGERFEENIPTIAKVWGEKLNRLDPEQRHFTEKAINDVFFEATQGTLHRHSIKINHDQGYDVVLS